MNAYVYLLGPLIDFCAYCTILVCVNLILRATLFQGLILLSAVLKHLQITLFPQSVRPSFTASYIYYGFVDYLNL
jgi:hypothetical protein